MDTDIFYNVCYLKIIKEKFLIGLILKIVTYFIIICKICFLG